MSIFPIPEPARVILYDPGDRVVRIADSFVLLGARPVARMADFWVDCQPALVAIVAPF